MSTPPINSHPGFIKLTPLLIDPTISDILINGHKHIFVERDGKLSAVAIRFDSEDEVRSFGEAIAKSVGRELDPSKPYVDARLPDGSRVNVVSPPLALDGTTISIRKFPDHSLTLDEMVTGGSLSQPMAEFLKACGHARVNIIISGGTGSGKTTLLNAIADFAESSERIVTVEDAAELRIHKPHVVRMETKPRSSSTSDYESVDPRELVRNALRMRPDRIIVGEVRGAEAYDMLQAMNTGHEGSLTTLHANHPRDAISRLENLLNFSMSNVPMRAVRGQITSAINLIVQVSRMKDGKRRITYISEVIGLEGDVITMQDIFQFIAKGENPDGTLKGEFKYMGIIPRITQRLKYWGEHERINAAFGTKT
jgi:pilus assembly protein CpaF